MDNWRTRTLAALEEAYGPNSPPVRGFLRIKFDDVSIIDVAERVLRERAAEEGVDLNDLKVELPPAEKALRRGLYEAAELLLSLTI